MKVESIKSFAKIISGISQTDRWVFLVCSGDMGEGKSCFTDKLSREVAKLNKTHFSLKNNMTYSRKDLKKWIDGEGPEKKGQKPECSVVLADEIISMFFKRNWYDYKQIDGIELLNKCRDRHLVILGNVPNFWDLDSAIYPIVTFWVHIHERARAWVIRKDPNPFTSDKWHRKENEKIFNKNNNPYKCHGFVCEIHWPDWTNDERADYYSIRNVKRINTEGQRGNVERYANVKNHRDNAIRYVFQIKPDITGRALAEVVDCSEELISSIKSQREPLRS